MIGGDIFAGQSFVVHVPQALFIIGLVMYGLTAITGLPFIFWTLKPKDTSDTRPVPYEMRSTGFGCAWTISSLSLMLVGVIAFFIAKDAVIHIG